MNEDIMTRILINSNKQVEDLCKLQHFNQKELEATALLTACCIRLKIAQTNGTTLNFNEASEVLDLAFEVIKNKTKKATISR